MGNKCCNYTDTSKEKPEIYEQKHSEDYPTNLHQDYSAEKLNEFGKPVNKNTPEITDNSKNENEASTKNENINKISEDGKNIDRKDTKEISDLNLQREMEDAIKTLTPAKDNTKNDQSPTYKFPHISMSSIF